mgnify:CR=1 FL=1
MLPVALAVACVATPAPARAQDDGAAGDIRGFDPAHTRFRFDVRTRWGQTVGGVFPRWQARLVELGDGRRRVHVALDAGAVHVEGAPRWTAMARGPQFFHAAAHPRIEFVSEPHAAALARTGGPMRGHVTLHGVRRAETFVVEPGACARPGEDCDVVVRGRVSRAAYGLRAYGFALGDSVRFTLRLRLAPLRS